MFLLKLSILIGMIVNVYYLYTKGDDYAKALEDGKLTVVRLFLGMFLTILFWPIAIYNNEFRRKV